MTGQYLGWICTGAMRPGTLWDGLEYAWPWLLIVLVGIGFCVGLYKFAKPSKTRTVAVAAVVICLAPVLLFAQFSFEVGYSCRPAEPSGYQKSVDEKGI